MRNHLSTDLSIGIRITALFTILTGLLFPALVWALAQLFFPHQANGSLVRRADGTILGSTLIGQQFTSPRYLHPRPSAAGSGYDAASSGGTNLGPTSAKLFRGITDDPATEDVDESYSGIADLATAYRKENGLPDRVLVPIDAVTRSASGLDPHISPANALLQAERIAAARGIDRSVVERMIGEHTEFPLFGIFGERRVNVLEVNLALDSLAHR